MAISTMTIPTRRWIIALCLALYIYFLLPATATAFYELYHLLKVEAVYWGYGAFKAAGYYLGASGYKLHASIGSAAAVLLLPMVFAKLRGH